MHYCANAKLTAATGLNDFFDLLPIAEADWRAGRIDGLLPNQIARNRFVLSHQEPLELANAVERHAVGELAAPIDGQPIMKRKRLAVLTQANLRSFVLS